MGSVEPRIKALEARHRELDKKVAQMYNKSYQEDELAKLKREKLKLKDEITTLTRRSTDG
tara:strand:+ start:3051 stop:3230 length:180 start_codon:yes stop_codon:yes gene_type:complete